MKEYRYTMKKRYISPVVELLEIDFAPIMTTMSLPTAGGGDDEERGDSDDQGAGGFRGDWSNIWEGM